MLFEAVNSWTFYDGRKIYLLTVEQLSSLPVGTKLISIIGKEVIKGMDKIDLDTRAGYTAYGLDPTNTQPCGNCSRDFYPTGEDDYLCRECRDNVAIQ